MISLLPGYIRILDVFLEMQVVGKSVVETWKEFHTTPQIFKKVALRFRGYKAIINYLLYYSTIWKTCFKKCHSPQFSKILKKFFKNYETTFFLWIASFHDIFFLWKSDFIKFFGLYQIALFSDFIIALYCTGFYIGVNLKLCYVA